MFLWPQHRCRCGRISPGPGRVGGASRRRYSSGRGRLAEDLLEALEEVGSGPLGDALQLHARFFGGPAALALVAGEAAGHQVLPAGLAALADAILSGKRHPKVGKAMHFHQAGLKFHYGNMHYVLNAGGNSFYEKRSRRRG